MLPGFRVTNLIVDRDARRGIAESDSDRIVARGENIMIAVIILFWAAITGLTGAIGRDYGRGNDGYWLGGLLGLLGLGILLVLGHRRVDAQFQH
jgi:hypothetical protein